MIVFLMVLHNTPPCLLTRPPKVQSPLNLSGIYCAFNLFIFIYLSVCNTAVVAFAAAAAAVATTALAVGRSLFIVVIDRIRIKMLLVVHANDLLQQQ